MEHPYCAAYQSENGEISIVVSCDELAAARVGERELTFNELGDPLVWEQIARRVNKHYDDYKGYGDLHIATEAMTRLQCEDCPWADSCEDMNEEKEGGNSMTKLEVLDAISEAILNNSNIEAEDDDEILFDGLEEVMLNVGKDDGDVTLLFTDGTEMKITVK